MARELDSPVPIGQAQFITGDELHIELRRAPDLSVDTSTSYLTTVLHLRDADGRILKDMVDIIPVAQWTTEIKDQVIALREAIKTRYEAGGLLPPGTDTTDI